MNNLKVSIQTEENCKLKSKAGGGKSRPITFRIKETDFIKYEKLCKKNRLILSDIPRTAIINLLNKKNEQSN